MKKEVLDLYDSQNRVTNKTMIRNSGNPEKGLRIKLTAIWIINDNKMLIQKTSKAKGDVWAITGGHVPHGSTSIVQIVIEAKEELGLNLDSKQLVYLGSVFKKYTIVDVYLTREQINQKLKFQKSEVASAKWFSKKELDDLIKNDNVRISTKVQYNRFVRRLLPRLNSKN